MKTPTEQIAQPSNTKIKPSSVVEHNVSEPSTTLKISTRIRNRPNYLKDYI